MYLPERLQKKGYREWNELVKGLMEVWDVSKRLGVESHLERYLREDPDGALTELLGTLGSDCLLLSRALRYGLRMAVRERPLAVLQESESREVKEELTALASDYPVRSRTPAR